MPERGGDDERPLPVGGGRCYGRPMDAPTEADVERLAAALGLPLEPGNAAPIAQNLAGLLVSAQLFVEFPLPDDVEPPPVFRP